MLFLFTANNNSGGDEMSFTYRYRKQLIFIFLVIILIGGGFSIYQFSYQKKRTVQKKILLSSKKTSNIKKVNQKEKVEEEIYYKVDIKGEVQNPGLYTLKEGSRVSDVIELAGGLTINGDTSVINLSKKISDEMVIIVYSKEEVRNFSVTKEREKEVINQCQNSYEGIINDGCINPDERSDSHSPENTMISINTATAEQLQTLTGIGAEKAKGIVNYREEHGNFQNIEEIKNVNGIGDSIFDKIKDYITL